MKSALAFILVGWSTQLSLFAEPTRPADTSSVLDGLQTALALPPLDRASGLDFASLAVVDYRTTHLTNSLGGEYEGDDVDQRELTIVTRAGKNIRQQTSFIPITHSTDELRDVLTEAIQHHPSIATTKLRGPSATALPATEIHVEEVDTDPTVDRLEWRRKIRRYLIPFANHGTINQAKISFQAKVETRWLANSAGARLQIALPLWSLSISASTQPSTGPAITREKTFVVALPSALPSEGVVLAQIDQLIAELAAASEAPALKVFRGPVLLSASSAAVLLTEVLLHPTQRSLPLPSMLDVYVDPLLEAWAGTALGSYAPYETDGRKARRTSFTPPTEPTIIPPGTLVFEFRNAVSEGELKRQFLDLLRQRQVPFGLFVAEVEPLISSQSRTVTPWLHPALAYRVYPDGREEITRLEGPLPFPAAIILAAENQSLASNASIPSIVAPSILLSEAELRPANHKNSN